jgi:signal transduction histidine kinase
MRARTASRLAWAIGLSSLALLGAQLAVMFVDRHLRGPASYTSGWSFANVMNGLTELLVPVFGILLASRRRENPLGWMFLAAGLALGMSGLGTVAGFHLLVATHGPAFPGRLLAWFASWFFVIPIAALNFLFLLFPTGHLPSPRWRRYARVAAAMFTVLGVGFIGIATAAWRDPFGQSPGTATNAAWFLLLVIPFLYAFVLSLTAVIVRFRRSTGEERLQLKWFVTGAVLVIVTFLGSFPFSVTPPWLSVLQSLAFVFLWISIGIAVLKYRLYEIDVVISRATLYGTLAVFITVVYLGLVVGIGSLVGNSRSPLLSAVAAALIAVAFQPLRRRAGRLANRLVYGRRATPYEVLSDFADRMAGTYSVDDVLPRTARMMAEGTGATRADVWLRVGYELRAAGSWPSGPEVGHLQVEGDHVEVPGATRAVPVRHRGELLGALSVVKAPGDPITPTEEKLLNDVAAQAGLALRNVRLIEDLRASRHRLVSAQDEERRRLERNIHDGAQQELVALAVKLNLAQKVAKTSPDKVEAMLEQIKTEAHDALENLRDLARGIYPPLLADQGLTAALTAQARKTGVPVVVDADGIGRFPRDAEAAVYFCTLEALQNVAKYANATAATVRVRSDDGHLSFSISDDGVGFDPSSTSYGTGLQGMADRLAALGGELHVASSSGQGAVVEGWVPVERVGPDAAS